jgi:hypothetical protein
MHSFTNSNHGLCVFLNRENAKTIFLPVSHILSLLQLNPVQSSTHPLHKSCNEPQPQGYVIRILQKQIAETLGQ